MAERRRTPETLDAADPWGLPAMLARFLLWMRVRSFSESTITRREIYLGYFVAWCAERSVARPAEATGALLERYARHLQRYRKADGQPLKVTSRYNELSAVRQFFRWLAKHGHIPKNPGDDLPMPRLGYHLPMNALSVSEVEQVLAQPDVRDPIGLRDRAIMEVLYSTGVRRQELLNLNVHDIDAGRRLVLVHRGKGGKDRVVPIGERALLWVDKYLDEARPRFTKGASDGPLFVNVHGGPLSSERVGQLVRDYVRSADLGKSGSCHVFRHTCATLMLEGGADIRYIQALLGHSHLTSTQVYTQVSIAKLVEVHERTHPARIGKPKLAQKTTEDGE